MRKFENYYSSPKADAQRNLTGITHYVDSDTLRYFHSRIVAFNVHDGGLLCSIIESVALDPDNRKRGFRHVVFDVTGRVLSRPDLDQSCRTSDQARKALYDYLNTIDAREVTREAIEAKRKSVNAECDRLLAELLA